MTHNTQDLCGKLDVERGFNMNTASGLPLWPSDPRPEDIRIEDVAASLSRLCRFNGHIKRGCWVNVNDIPEGAHADRFVRNEAFIRFQCYSVAQHSTAVERRVSQAIDDVLSMTAPSYPPSWYNKLRLAALLHDSAEFIVGDMIKPQKIMYPNRKEIENRCDVALAARFGFPVEMFDHPMIKEADYRMFLTEKRDVCNDSGETDFGTAEAEPYPYKIIPILPHMAERQFLTRLYELYDGE